MRIFGDFNVFPREFAFVDLKDEALVRLLAALRSIEVKSSPSRVSKLNFEAADDIDEVSSEISSFDRLAVCEMLASLEIMKVIQLSS